MGTPFAISTNAPFAGQTFSSAPIDEVPWEAFASHIESENFIEAGQMISDGRINIKFHADFYDSKIKQLLLSLTETPRFDLDRNANLRKVLRITEFFDAKGIESTYCRVCRAAVYLYLEENSKLEALLPVLCRPRAYRQASDLLELNRLMNNWDEREMRIVFFAPLHAAVIKYTEQKSAKYPTALMGGKA